MANFDILSLIKPEQGFAPVVVTDDTVTTTGAIDLQGFQGCAFVVNI